MSTVLVLVASMALSMLVIKLRLLFAGRGLDLPGHRSLHQTPVPHGGGLGVIVVALVAGWWYGLDAMWLVGVAVLASVSLLDDWVHLPFWLRLGVHLGVAASVVFLHGLDVNPVTIGVVVVIAWAINAYNFMDGADGLAGSMAVTGFGAYAVAFSIGGFAELAGLCFALSAAALGFLVFNWHPAKIFMGDVGSIPLGFLAGGLGWYGVVADAWPLWFPLTVFAPFLLDASATLTRRACRRERVWEAHRDHYYQRMVRMGCTHAAMCSRWLALMLGSAVLALALHGGDAHAGWVGAAAWWCVLMMLGRQVDRRWDQDQVRIK
ncbi:MAG: glycosyltransferase family 4 protein [Rhodocyclales bacterium]|nr:glycosyltransferase family 4 protein [Rhodocyclales bacterium]